MKMPVQQWKAYESDGVEEVWINADLTTLSGVYQPSGLRKQHPIDPIECYRYAQQSISFILLCIVGSDRADQIPNVTACLDACISLFKNPSIVLCLSLALSPASFAHSLSSRRLLSLNGARRA